MVWMAALLAGMAHASPQNGFGLGVVIGEPTGLSLAWQSPAQTIQSHLSWSLERNWIRVNVDYLKTVAEIPTDGPALPLYVGIGGALAAHDDDWGDDNDWYDDDYAAFGARIPLGMRLLPRQVPIDVFLEVAPVVYLIPSTDVDIDLGLGVRFYF